jgi:hypothetical protein
MLSTDTSSPWNLEDLYLWTGFRDLLHISMHFIEPLLKWNLTDEVDARRVAPRESTVHLRPHSLDLHVQVDQCFTGAASPATDDGGGDY